MKKGNEWLRRAVSELTQNKHILAGAAKPSLPISDFADGPRHCGQAGSIGCLISLSLKIRVKLDQSKTMFKKLGFLCIVQARI